MFLKLLTTILTVGYFTLQSASGATDKVVCYYQSWNAEIFPPSDIDCKICTIINYSFLGLKSDGSLRLDGGTTVINKLKELKKKCPKVKLMFSVGGWSEGTKTFSEVAASSSKRNQMASSALKFLTTHKFDGIDIDWEYPAKRGGKSADKKNFIEMLKALRKKLKSGNNKYLLSVAVESTPDTSSYDVPNVASNVDFINIMTYDFGSPSKTSFNAPLYAGSKDSQWDKDNANCAAAVKNWKNKGAPASKLILGLAFYSHKYTLKNANDNGVGAPVSKDDGQLAYRDICKLKSGWTDKWDNKQKVPYKYNGKQWISYDSTRSIKEKVKWAKKQKLGGVMMWAVDQDDNKGSCGTKFPLLKEIKKNL